ncbi:hypothetical protein MPSEU_000053400 [Mayamaea pseudoterrestris]|nr:hypothetical protein MPSEU_000053400 [Mayamaea pseudoterrestris]
MPSTAVMSHNATDNRWSTACETGDDPRAVSTFGLRRSDKTSIAPQRPTRRGSDMSEAPPAFCSSQRKQSQQTVKSPKKQQHDDSSKKKKESSAKKSPKKNVEPIAPPVIVQNKKNFEDSLKRLELEDITETEHTDELSDSDPLPTTRSPTHKHYGSYNNNNDLNISIHTAPACVSRYAMSPKKTTPIDRNDRYANFDSGFGEKRESRMHRVQRINSSDRVMPSLESQQRAIANSRRKKDCAKIVQEEEVHESAAVEACSSNLVINDLNLSVHTAPADVRRYKHTNKTSSMDKDERYANFDSGFGEKRESRMRRVQRIKSSDRVMPSWESQQRAIANSRRTATAETSGNRLQQELESVRSSPRMSIKDRMAIFSGSSSELSTPL